MLTKRARLIWQGLVRYANADQIDLDDLHKTVSMCMPWAAQLSVLSFGDFVLNNPQVFPKQALEYHVAIRELLAALCGEPRRLPEEAKKFLMDHGAHVRTFFDEAPFDPDDEEHSEESNRVWKLSGEPKKRPLGIHIRSKNYKDIADPICDFILDELDRMRGENQEVPIFLCQNPLCKRLIMPARVGRGRFCPDRCKSAYHRGEMSQLVPNDYQWLYRHYMLVHAAKPRGRWEVGSLRRKLARNKANFERIKSDHKDVSRIQNLIAKLEPYTR